eukprot:CAMPEP_0173292060 /NCGR_PEP_ID=MMETSP1143-20121109/12511_1 /TAXON_ID=483371 /ORGANISM="non described non described, Strain CCMP2298" /LENGTH=62 /DNA_ID=CAMNT_0014231391 /DNA_START=254 /DNA_END=442 /DNA_ORIENTATION=-
MLAFMSPPLRFSLPAAPPPALPFFASFSWFLALAVADFCAFPPPIFLTCAFGVKELKRSALN